MKISINYDLISKINEAKLGFSLQKYTKNVFTVVCIQSAVYSLLHVKSEEDIFKLLLPAILFFIIIDTLLEEIHVRTLKQRTKSLALSKLIDLSIMLRDINVNTDYELLLESYVYNTKYSLGFDNKLLPYIKQDKYIMVPAYSNGEQKEVSLVQEHIVGSSEYSISHGTPKKVLKLASNPV